MAASSTSAYLRALARPGRSLNTCKRPPCSVVLSGLAARARRYALSDDTTTNDIVFWSDRGEICAPRPFQALTTGAPPVGADRPSKERSPDASLCARRGRFTVTLNEEFARRALLPHFKHEKIDSLTNQLYSYVRARLPRTPGPTLCMRMRAHAPADA